MTEYASGGFASTSNAMPTTTIDPAIQNNQEYFFFKKTIERIAIQRGSVLVMVVTSADVILVTA